MALNTYIERRLQNWAMWAERRDSGGTGWKKKVNYEFEDASTGPFAGTPEFDDECDEIEQCVIAVRATDERSFAVIMLRYRTGGTEVQKAKELGCCEATYRARVGIAQQKILGFLGDLHADIKLPTLEYGSRNFNSKSVRTSTA